MANVSTLPSFEEYLQTSYKPDCDFVDDHIEERNVAKFDHNRTQALILAWFMSHEKAWNLLALPEQRAQVSARRVRIPDVCLIRAGVPREQVSLTPHLLCVEVLSPEDRLSRTTKVLDDFAGMGVENLWIVDPIERVGYIYQPGGRLQIVTDRLAIPRRRSTSICRASSPPSTSHEAVCPLIAPVFHAMSGTAGRSQAATRSATANSRPPFAPAVATTWSPCRTLPSRILTASGSCTSLWIARFSGLAP